MWVFCIDEAYYIGLQRSAQDDAPFRAQRTVERPGSLPPTIAAALAFLGNPAPGETILDPVCGSGTLLAEALRVRAGCRVDRDRRRPRRRGRGPR